MQRLAALGAAVPTWLASAGRRLPLAAQWAAGQWATARARCLWTEGPAGSLLKVWYSPVRRTVAGLGLEMTGCSLGRVVPLSEVWGPMTGR